MGDRFKPESVIGMGQNMHSARTLSLTLYMQYVSNAKGIVKLPTLKTAYSRAR